MSTFYRNTGRAFDGTAADPDRASNELIVKRVQIGLALAAFADVVLAIGEMLRGDMPVLLPWVRLAALAGIAGFFLLGRLAHAERHATTFGLAAAALLCAVCVSAAIVSGESSSALLAIVVLQTGAAAIVPWKTRAQAALAAIAAATIFATEIWHPRAFLQFGLEREGIGIVAIALISVAIAHELERHRNRFELILQSSGDGICGVDVTGRCTFINRAALRLLGYESSAEALGRDLHALFHHSLPDGSPNPRERCPLFEVLRTGRSQRSDHEQFWKKDGSSIPVDCSYSAIVEDGAVRGVVVSFADLSARREAERTRSNLVAMLSHDIKNPLSAILGFASLLRDEPAASHEEQAEVLDEIEISARKAIGLAVNFVDATRAEGGMLRVDPIEGVLDDVVRHAIHAESTAARARHVAIVAELDPALPKVSFDPTLFDRVIGNLLSNAVKYSPNGGVVTVRTSTQGDEVLLVVADQGPGVPTADRPKLFKRFSQVGRGAKNSSGLGLFIVKTIVDAHGGRVWLECPPEGGSTFVVALPRTAKSSPRPAISPAGTTQEWSGA